MHIYDKIKYVIYIICQDTYKTRKGTTNRGTDVSTDNIPQSWREAQPQLGKVIAGIGLIPRNADLT